MTGLIALVANLLGAGLVILPFPLLEDLAKAFDCKRHLLVVDLGGVDGCSTRCRLLLLLLRRLKCHRLCFRRGGFIKLVDLLGAFDHTFKTHKIPDNVLGGHLSVSRITTN